MQVTINIADELAARVQARGLDISSYVSGLLEKQLSDSVAVSSHISVDEAIDNLRELRKGSTLGGLSLQDLVQAGRKY